MLSGRRGCSAPPPRRCAARWGDHHGGEPFAQPAGLLALLLRLKMHTIHIVVYTGYTLEALARRPEPKIREALALIDLLIDGPFVARLAEGAGEWRGSRNQRVIHRPADFVKALP